MSPALAPELLVFMSVAPVLERSFSMAPARGPVSGRFHTIS